MLSSTFAPLTDVPGVFILSRMGDQAVAKGILLARGVCRALDAFGFVSICEYPITRNLRVDVLALGPKGEVWVIECKSSLADFRTDQKWAGYLPWCDRFFWAVDTTFPRSVLPEHHGLFLADSYGAEMVRNATEHKLSAARRKSVVLGAARAAARRLHRLGDPRPEL